MVAKKTSDKIVLDVQKREINGKKVKQLRKEGILPANIYGKDFVSQAISLNTHDFLKTYKEAGETQLIYLNLDKKEIPVLMHNLQLHSVSGHPLHVDFRKIDLTKKIEAHVPLKFINESPAVHQNKGDMLTILNALTVEALPGSIPHDIEIDISILNEVDDEIRIKDLKTVAGYSVKDDPESVIVKIAEHKEEVIAPEPAPEVAEGGPAAEGEAPAEGEEGSKEQTQKKEEAKPEEKKE